MALSKRNRKRKEQKLIEILNNKFRTICSNYSAMIFTEDPKQVKEYQENLWKNFCRKIIFKNPKYFNNSEKREKLLGKFSEFASNFEEDAKAENIILNGDKENVSKYNQILNEHGIKTQALTLKGLAKRVKAYEDKVDMKQLSLDLLAVK